MDHAVWNKTYFMLCYVYYLLNTLERAVKWWMASDKPVDESMLVRGSISRQQSATITHCAGERYTDAGASTCRPCCVWRDESRGCIHARVHCALSRRQPWTTAGRREVLIRRRAPTTLLTVGGLLNAHHLWRHQLVAAADDTDQVQLTVVYLLFGVKCSEASQFSDEKSAVTWYIHKILRSVRRCVVKVAF